MGKKEVEEKSLLEKFSLYNMILRVTEYIYLYNWLDCFQNY